MRSTQNLKQYQWSLQNKKIREKLNLNKNFDNFLTTTDEASTSFSFESNTTEKNFDSSTTEISNNNQLTEQINSNIQLISKNNQKFNNAKQQKIYSFFDSSETNGLLFNYF